MITSPSNKKIKEVIGLQKKAKARRERDVFVVEGMKMFLETDPKKIREVYLSEDVTDRLSKECRQKLTSLSIHYEIVTQEIFRKLSDTKTPQGILCVVEQYHYTLTDLLTLNRSEERRPLLLILEDIQDPGNIGTIFRAGEGAGVSGIIMSSNTVDVYNPKTVRSTMGSICRMPFLYSETLTETIIKLKEYGISVYAAHLQGKDSYDLYDYRTGSAFLIGNEGNGLKEETAHIADHLIRIPMLGEVESLNAAVASSLLVYEAARQRRVYR